MFSLFMVVYCLVMTLREIFALDPSQVIYAVNSGGPNYVSSNNIVYREDEKYLSGSSKDFGTDFQIDLTDTPEIYLTERYSTKSFSYEIPVPAEGDYVLILKFVEMSSEFKRSFDVKLGDLRVIRDLDIFSMVGKACAYDKYIPFTLHKQNIIVRKEVAKGAWTDGKLTVTFSKGITGEPKVNAILVVKGGLPDTDYSKQQHEINQRKIMQEKYEKVTGRKPDGRGSLQMELETEMSVEEIVDTQEVDSIVSLLFSFPALLFLGLLILITLLAFCKVSDKDKKV